MPRQKLPSSAVEHPRRTKAGANASSSSLRRSYVKKVGAIPPAYPGRAHRVHSARSWREADLGPLPTADYTSILVSNAAWRDSLAQIPYERRLLLIPKCLRVEERCPAPFRRIRSPLQGVRPLFHPGFDCRSRALGLRGTSGGGLGNRAIDDRNRERSRRSLASAASMCWRNASRTWRQQPSQAWPFRFCKTTASIRQWISTGSGT